MKELIERFEKETGNEFYVININNVEDLYNSDFVEWMAKQLALCGVRSMFSEEQLEQAWSDGCECGETRSGFFDIENYL